MALKLYEYFEDYGRMGSLSGLYVMDEQDFEELKGKFYYGDELLGKHSEVFLDFYGNSDVKSDDQEFLGKLVELLGVSVSGETPFNYDEEG